VRTGDTVDGLRRVGTALAIGMVCLLLAPAVHGAAAAEPSLTASFSPGTLDIASGGTRKAELLVTNTGSTPVTDLSCTFTSDDGISVPAAASLPVTSLAVSASTSLAVAVTRAVGAPAASSVEAVLSYMAGTAAGQHPETVVASLTVGTPAAPTAPAARLLVTPTLGRAQLVEYQSTDLIFTIANQSDRGETLTSVKLTYPSTLQVTATLADGAATAGSNGSLRLAVPGGPLGPGDTDVVHATVSAPDAVQPGDALVGLEVSAKDAVDQTTATVVSTQKLTFSVLGESDVLQALGVPSLLFVPGIVMAVILWALWTQVAPRKTFSLQPDGAGVEGKVVMWVFALLPSLALPFLYPFITSAVLRHRRDYRTAYGLDDILYLWLIAAVAAFVLWGLWVLLHGLASWLWIPQKDDQPRALIRKFALRPWPWNRNLLRRSALCDEQRVMILRNTHAGPLVTPAVTYTVSGQGDAERAELDRLIPDHPKGLGHFLRKHQGTITLSYQPDAPLAGPAVVTDDKLSAFAEDRLVRERT
jgi:hypothetical protein